MKSICFMNTNINLKIEELKKQMNICYIRNNNVTISILTIPMKTFGVKKLLPAIIVLFFSTLAYGQFVTSGGVPAKTRWMQLQGDTYKVIYPKGSDSLAARYLWHLEQNRPAVMLGLGGIKPAKIPAVLYNGTVNSNGMVVWAPKRMELYTLPPQQTYPVRWEEQLAVHESRHVGQISHFTKGIFRLGSVLAGEQSPAIGVGIYPSRWFLEGDATVAETELSNAGRGRSAEFMEYYRASFLEGDMRNWYRWKLDSYKYYTPDRYAFGYLIGSTLRYRTGKFDYAGELLPALVKDFYNPNVRNASYRKVADGTPRWYFGQGQQMMTRHWKDEMHRRGTLDAAQEVLTEREKGYMEYFSPVKVGADSLLYIRHGFRNHAQLVLVSGGKEKVLDALSSSVTSMCGNGNHIYYIEKVPDARWSNMVYGELFRYDLKTGEVKKYGKKNFYGNVQVNGNGELLLVVEHMPQGGSRIKVLSAATGEQKGVYPAPLNGQLTCAAWLGEDIYALCITGRGQGLFRLHNGKWSEEIGEHSATVEDLRSNGTGLYFVSDMDGVRNVYGYSPQTGELTRLTNSRYGATAPLMDGDDLYYSSLELGGRFPVKVNAGLAAACGSEFNPRVENGELVGQYRYLVADELTRQASEALAAKGMLARNGENGTSIVKYEVPFEEFRESVEPKRYSKAAHLLRFHSWAPFYYDVDRILETDYDNLHEVISAGATAYSQNTLGTAVTMLGYSYNKGYHAGHFKMKWQGWYPVIQLEADVNDGDHYYVKLVSDSSGVKQVIHMDSTPLVEAGVMAYIPWNFSHGGWNRQFVPQIKWEMSNNGFYSYEDRVFKNAHYLTAAVQYAQMRSVARSAIYPKWGFGGSAVWRGALDAGENMGSQNCLSIYGYIPGLASTHGIKLSYTQQKQNNAGKMYYMGNLASMPRGWIEEVYGEEYRKFSADYAFPVYLGDVSVLRSVYLKRLQVIPFVDYATNSRVVDARGKSATTSMYSYGSAVLVDLAPFSIGIELSVGVRYSINGNNGGLKVPGSNVQVMVSTDLL